MKRIFLYALSLVLGFVSFGAIAVTGCDPVTQYRTKILNESTGTRTTNYTSWLSSPQAACAASTTRPAVSGAQCFYVNPGNEMYIWSSSIDSQSTCPYGGNPIAGGCNCPDPCATKAGMWDNGGDPQSVNLPGPRPFYSGETNAKGEMPGTVCLNGCVADTTQDRGDGMVAGSWWGFNMNPKYNGQSCTPGVQKPGSPKPKDSPEKKCVDQGQGFGYVNDKVVCVKPDSGSGTAKKSTETKNPDGTTTKTDTVTNISCNAEGACSTTTTTTTTVINADGSVASTKTDTKKEDSQGNAATGNGDGTGFCKENPTSPMCKSGSFTGSCAQAPACEGDPIQCATAKAVFETNCKTLKPGEPPTTTEPVGEKKHNLSFEVSELSGGGVCPADRFIQINGKMVHFELSVICQFAIMLRPIIIALAWLIAGYIVFGWGNKRG